MDRMVAKINSLQSAVGERINRWFPFIFLGIVVFLTRLPFILAGFGTDPDAYRVFGAARHIAKTGEYVVSRIEGHPVQEYIYSLLYWGGPVVLNGLTALFSVVAVIFFALSFRRIIGKNYWFASIALALTPIIYINSVNSIDYVWALGFIMGALYFTLGRKYVLAGILLGLAIGCRASSVLLLPAIAILVQNNNKNTLLNIVKIVVPTIFIGGLCYIPYIVTYGFISPTASSNFLADVVSVPSIVAKLSIGVWGLTGFAGVFFAFFYIIIGVLRKRTGNSDATNSSLSARIIVVWGATAIVYLIIFITLPFEPGYFIPIIPLLLIVFARFLSRKALYILLILIALAPFFPINVRKQNYINRPIPKTSITLNIISNQTIVDFLRPIIIDEHFERKYLKTVAKQAIYKTNSLSGENVIVCGSWLPYITAQLPFDYNGCIKYEYILDDEAARIYRNDGYSIYYLPGTQEFNAVISGNDLTNYDAKPLLK